ncbi:uncharacterized protein [Anolis sagrei]|uniref:uncharacterized protein n=1 Tax=Anolis sagrei TaxID=38937 RepID=UPI0035224E64
MAIQNILLHRTCFCCKHCGRKLSLLSYTTFDGAFYCKVHHKLLSEAKGPNQEENSHIPEKYQPLQKAKQKSLGLGSKSDSNQTGKLLIREKMQPRLCGLQSQAGLKSAGQIRHIASWNKPQTHWPPLNGDDAGRESYRSETSKKWLQNPIVLVQNQNRAENNPRKALRDDSRMEAKTPAEKKQSRFLTVTFPKSAEADLFQTKIVGGKREPRVLAKRQPFMDEINVRVQARKEGQTISKKATPLQYNQLRLKRTISVVSPFISIPPSKPFSVGLFPSRSEPPGMKKVTPLANAGLPGTSFASHLAKFSPEGQKLRRTSSSKGDSGARNGKQDSKRAEPLPKTRMKLPGLLPPNQKEKKHLETDKSDTLVTLVLEEVEQPSQVKAEATRHHDQSQASGFLPEHKDERSHAEEHDNEELAPCLNSENTHLEVNQVSEQSWVDRSDFPRGQVQVMCTTNLQGPENEEEKTQHEEVSIKKEEDTQLERKPGSFVTLNSISDSGSQDTKPERKETVSATEVEMGNGHSFSSTDDPENVMISPRIHLEDNIWTCNETSSAQENQELVKTASIYGENNNENNILQSKEDKPEGTVVHPFPSQIKEPETINSHEVAYLTENQVTGHVEVDIISSPDDCAGKHSLKNERNRFASLFHSKIQGTAPKQTTAGTKKVSKTPSAFVTLFGYSLGKDKNLKEKPGKPSAQPLIEASDQGRLEDACSSSLPRLGFSKEEEVSEIATESMSFEGDLQDNCGSCSYLETSKDFNANTELGPDISSIIVTQNLKVPEQSDLNIETFLRDPSKTSLFAKSQHSLADIDNMLQHPASPLEKLDPEMLTDWRSDQDIQGLSNLPRLGDQDLEKTPQGVSLLNPSSGGEQHVPDMLLCSMGVEGRNPQSTPHLDTIEHTSSGLISSENPSQVNISGQLPESGTPTLVEKDQLNDKHPPGSGNLEMFQHDEPQFSSDNTIEVDLHGGQATESNSPTGQDQFFPFAALHHIPELLRDTIKGKVEETTETGLQELIPEEESN